MTSPARRNLTRDEAQTLTDRIKAAAEQVWVLLLEAHERKAWVALGYSTWADYVCAEFDMSARHAYRLLDQATVIREIEVAADVTHGSHQHAQALILSEREARDIKPMLTEVIADIRERVAALHDRAPDRVNEVVRNAVLDARMRVRFKRVDNSFSSRQERIPPDEEFPEAAAEDLQQLAERRAAQRERIRARWATREMQAVEIVTAEPNHEHRGWCEQCGCELRSP